MALQKNIQTKWGIDLPEAYIRVTNLNLNYNTSVGNIVVATYKDKVARDENKQPVYVNEYRIKGDPTIPSRQASYTINVNAIESGSLDEFKLDLDGDGVYEVALVEGANFISDGTLATTSANIVEALQGIVQVSDEWIPYDLGDGAISLIARKDGLYDGVNGNNLDASGSGVSIFGQTIVGQDRVLGVFDKYYGVDVINQVDKNVIQQSYKYLKTLNDFVDCVDVLDVLE